MAVGAERVVLSMDGPRENGWGLWELSPSGMGRGAGAKMGVEWFSGGGWTVGGVEENLRSGTKC